MGAPEAEQTPLLVNNVAPGYAVAPAPPTEKQPRRWRGELYHVAGDCSPEDVAAGCLAWHAPYVVFSWNMRRAFQLSFWRELAKIALVLGGWYVVLCLASHALVFSCVGWPQPPEHDGPGGPGMMGPHHHDDDDDDLEGPGHFHPHGFADIPAECRARTVSGLAVVCVVALAVISYCIFYAARRRQQIRERFGIVGTFTQDVLSWTFCSVCALAQETRTLMSNNVHEGVWYGPAPYALPAAGTAAPPAQQMV